MKVNVCQRGVEEGEVGFKCLDDFKGESFTSRNLRPSNSVCADLKKIDLGINVKGELHSKKRIFFVIAKKKLILS